MTNAKIADVFEEIADLLEFQGANPFRVRAYRNGARVIRDLPEPVAAILTDENRRLTDIEGIGKDLADKIGTLVETGELPQREALLAEIPGSVLALLRIPGLGPKKAAVLFNELDVRSLAELKSACETGKVRQLKGFAAKTEQTILKGINIASQADERIYWANADEIANAMRAYMRRCKAVGQLEVAGSYRRGKETVGDLDVLVDSNNSKQVMDHFGKFEMVQDVIARGDTKMSVRTIEGLHVDLRVVPRKSFGAALQYFTGSKEHNVILRGRAKQRGMKINEYGVFHVSDNAQRYICGSTEEEVYAALDLPVIPPELREARHEFEWAEAGKLPALIDLADILGDLHMHTTDTDGKATLEEMVAAAQQRSLQYIAVTDHSRRVSMAHGLDSKRLREQWKKIDRLNAKLGKQFTVLKGIECDILEKGGMDLPDDVLAEADWVLASVHYGQKQSREQITDRILGAIENSHVTAIAHPTGRLINRREPYEVDLDAVFEAAKKHRTLLELNANPARLDLNDVYCAAAKAHGVSIVISTDAHSVAGLDVMRFGIVQARRAGLTKHDVVNTRSWPQLMKTIGK